jgi:N-acetylglutamate synthase-like GNAT family acetyltransferase
MSAVPAAPLRVIKRRPVVSPVPATSGVKEKVVALQSATAAHADAIHALIVEHLADGHLLPRERGEVAVHVGRFVVALEGDRVVACAELAPLSRTVAEVRSLVVVSGTRNTGVGRKLVDELLRRAEVAGYEKLCAFTHTPAYFVHMDFSIVPHAWLPEKIVTDCAACRHFRHCGQYAVVHGLGRSRHSCVPLTALHA